MKNFDELQKISKLNNDMIRRAMYLEEENA